MTTKSDEITRNIISSQPELIRDRIAEMKEVYELYDIDCFDLSTAKLSFDYVESIPIEKFNPALCDGGNEWFYDKSNNCIIYQMRNSNGLMIRGIIDVCDLALLKTYRIKMRIMNSRTIPKQYEFDAPMRIRYKAVAYKPHDKSNQIEYLNRLVFGIKKHMRQVYVCRDDNYTVDARRNSIKIVSAFHRQIALKLKNETNETGVFGMLYRKNKKSVYGKVQIGDMTTYKSFRLDEVGGFDAAFRSCILFLNDANRRIIELLKKSNNALSNNDIIRIIEQRIIQESDIDEIIDRNKKRFGYKRKLDITTSYVRQHYIELYKNEPELFKFDIDSGKTYCEDEEIISFVVARRRYNTVCITEKTTYEDIISDNNIFIDDDNEVYITERYDNSMRIPFDVYAAAKHGDEEAIRVLELWKRNKSFSQDDVVLGRVHQLNNDKFDLRISNFAMSNEMKKRKKY